VTQIAGAEAELAVWVDGERQGDNAIPLVDGGGPRAVDVHVPAARSDSAAPRAE
jgi:hypothetical protein